MRRAFTLCTIVCALALTAVVAPRPAAASVNVSIFFDELAPYGDWVSVAQYGRVWCPRHVHARWQPYVDGEWVYTEYGWTWISNADGLRRLGRVRPHGRTAARDDSERRARADPAGVDQRGADESGADRERRREPGRPPRRRRAVERTAERVATLRSAWRARG